MLCFLYREKEWPIILQTWKKGGSLSFLATKANLGHSTNSWLGSSVSTSRSIRTLAEKLLVLFMVQSSKERDVNASSNTKDNFRLPIFHRKPMDLNPTLSLGHLHRSRKKVFWPNKSSKNPWRKIPRTHPENPPQVFYKGQSKLVKSLAERDNFSRA